MVDFQGRILSWFVPEDVKADPTTLRQAARAVTFGLAMMFWAPVFGPIYYWLGSPRAAVMVGLAALAIAASMLSLRLTKSVAFSGNLIAASVFAVLIAIASVTGGIGAAPLWWLPSVRSISEKGF